MDIQKRLEIIKEVGEEIIDEKDLTLLLEKKKNPIAYDGFEPSGRLHIAQGLMRSINVNKMSKAGCKFKILLADWHAWANNKFGGDLDKIQTAGKYFIEVWKKSGMDLDNVEFVWVSDYMNKNEYLKLMMQIARNATLNRVIRCSQIMGRKESDSLQASQIFYAVMQCSDIFYLKADICQLGMDQRKVNMLAREIGPKIGLYAPVAVHNHMLMGLTEPPKDAVDSLERTIAMKMSKSNPDSAIFMDDNEEDIKRKINKAYCPEGITKDNPILEYSRYILFQVKDSLTIERPVKWGGDLTFNSYEELEKAFSEKKVHPMDLKNAVSKEITRLLMPVREHFEKNSKAFELREQVRSYQITR